MDRQADRQADSSTLLMLEVCASHGQPAVPALDGGVVVSDEREDGVEMQTVRTLAALLLMLGYCEDDPVELAGIECIGMPGLRIRNVQR